MLRLAPALTLLLFLGPVLAGMAGTLALAFGYLPSLGGTALSLAPWRAAWEAPGFVEAVRITAVSGTLATLGSFVLAVLIAGALYDTRAGRRGQAWLAPLLAAPHAAVAIGLAFVLAPSGWIARALAPLTGWTRPPDIATVQDADGLALAVGLIVKETPYLLLMILAALGQVPWRGQREVARAMGYGRFAVWLKVVLPQLYPQLRLPLYAVIAYSFTVVDMALVLGPSTPPTLAVMAVRWFLDRDPAMLFLAAAGALAQVAMVAAAIALWRGGEAAAARLGPAWIAAGARGHGWQPLAGAGKAAALLVLGANAAALLVHALWSLAAAWRFPDLLPSAWTLATWQRAFTEMGGPALATLVAGAASVTLAAVLAVACLENEQRHGRRAGTRALLLLYLPLLVPQGAFLIGLQVWLVRAGLDGGWLAVVWTHLVFVFPYLFLSLGEPWRALDGRYARAAAALGAGPLATLVRVKLPILLRPLAVAAAIGFAASAALYLPTLFAGAGRIATLTTEAVTLASGADRRVVAMAAFLQAALPLLAYAAALAVPALLWRNRRGLRA